MLPPSSKALTWWNAKIGSVSTDFSKPPPSLSKTWMRKPRSGRPAIVADEGREAELEPQGIDDQRKLHQHEILLGHGEAVHVGRAVDRHLGYHAFRAAVVVDGEQPVAALHAELDDVAELALAPGIVVGMRDRYATADGGAVAIVAERRQRLGVEADRQRRLGESDCRSAKRVDIDVAVVGELHRLEDRGHALKQRAAGIGRKLAARKRTLRGTLRDRNSIAESGCGRKRCRRRSRTGAAWRARRTSD